MRRKWTTWGEAFHAYRATYDDGYAAFLADCWARRNLNNETLARLGLDR
jgi:hypothetical protein